MHDVIIIGGGAAGLAAAMLVLGKGRSVLLIAEHLGGKAGTHQHLADEQAEEYIGGEEVASLFARAIAVRSDAVLHDQVASVSKERSVFRVVTAQHGVREAAAVILASGVTPVPLDVPGAAQLVGYGIGYSATTHAHLVADKRVAIIGSTPRALRGAHELAQTAAHIFLIAPERGALSTSLGIALPYRYNVDVLERTQPVEVVGTSGVERLVVTQDGTRRSLAVDAVFVDLGLRPNTSMVRHLVALDRDGFVRVDADGATNVSGLFAAGDATTVISENVLIAVGDGARAARSAYDYVLAHPSLRRREP